MSDYTASVIKLFPLGVRESRVVVGSTNLALGGIQSVEAHEVLQAQTLPGDDVIQARHAYPTEIQGTLKMAGVSLKALAIITGRAVSTAGSTPTRTSTQSVAQGDSYPYFTLYVRANTDDGGDIWYVIYKCKLSDGAAGTFAFGEFRTTDLSFGAVADSNNSNKLMDIVSHETATSLPTS